MGIFSGVMGPQQMGFNPLTGIRSFLTRLPGMRCGGFASTCFNPLTGIRSFLTRLPGMRCGGFASTCFNPLTGIRSFLTYWRVDHADNKAQGFNPLTGIRSFLTKQSGPSARAQSPFQSPHGDSFLF